MNVIKQRIQKEENSLINNANTVEIRNAEMLRTVLILGMLIYTALLMISFVEESFMRNRIYYLSILMYVIAYYEFVKAEILKVNSVILLYIGYIIMIVFSGVSNHLLLKGDLGILEIGIVVMVPLTILDRSDRITLFELDCLLSYFVFTIPYKNNDIQVQEVVTLTMFTIFALVIGGLSRSNQLENLELRRISHEREITDALTGLNNRRKLFQLEHNGIDDIGALAMIDIDQFKLFNDTYGHQQGDECLREVANCFNLLHQEKGITFYRYGGEEFVATFTSRCKQDVIEDCKSINAAISALNIENKASTHKIVTVSIGVTMAIHEPIEYVGAKSTKLERLINEADIALYEAKMGGRNRAIMSQLR